MRRRKIRTGYFDSIKPGLVAPIAMLIYAGIAGWGNQGESIAAESNYVIQSLQVGNRPYSVVLPDGYALEYLNQDMRKPRVMSSH